MPANNSPYWWTDIKRDSNPLPELGSEPALAGAAAIALIWITTGVNISGVGSVGVLQLVTTLLKLLPLFIVAVGGMAVKSAVQFESAMTQIETLVGR